MIKIKEGPYKDANIKIKINFSEKYPFESPKLKFDPILYHPNVDQKTG